MASSSDYKVSQTNHCWLDIQCVEIHNSINTFYTSAHPKDNSYEVSLQWDQNICLTFMVIMATAAFFKTPNPKCTSTHPKDQSCDVQLQSANNIIFFNFHGYHGNDGHFENFKLKINNYTFQGSYMWSFLTIR